MAIQVEVAIILLKVRAKNGEDAGIARCLRVIQRYPVHVASLYTILRLYSLREAIAPIEISAFD